MCVKTLTLKLLAGHEALFIIQNLPGPPSFRTDNLVILQPPTRHSPISRFSGTEYNK